MNQDLYNKIHSGEYDSIDPKIFEYYRLDYRDYKPPKEFFDKWVFKLITSGAVSWFITRILIKWMEHDVVENNSDYSDWIDRIPTDIGDINDSFLSAIIAYPLVFGVDMLINDRLYGILYRYNGGSSDWFNSYIPGTAKLTGDDAIKAGKRLRQNNVTYSSVPIKIQEEFTEEVEFKDIFFKGVDIGGERIEIRSHISSRLINDMSVEKVEEGVKTLSVDKSNIDGVWSSVFKKGIKLPDDVIDTLFNNISSTSLINMGVSNSMSKQSFEKYMPSLNASHILSAKALTDDEVKQLFYKSKKTINIQTRYTRYFSEEFILNNKDMFFPRAINEASMAFKISNKGWKELCAHWGVTIRFPGKKMKIDQVLPKVHSLSPELFRQIANQQPVSSQDEIEDMIKSINKNQLSNITQDLRDSCKIATKLLEFANNG